MRRRSLPRRIALLLFKWCCIALILSVVWVWLYAFINPPTTLLIIKRKVAALRNPSISDKAIYQQWRPYAQLSPQLVLAVIAAEDQTFPFHNGFDFKAIEEAIAHNKTQVGKKKMRIKGASTISQQTAKNVFLWEGRDWVRKGLETYFTLLIETFWSKERILEVYLNVAETGDRVFGAEAAAKIYFRKTAQQLNADEAALIAACLPSPRLYSPVKPIKYVNDRKKWIMRQAKAMGGTAFLSAVSTPKPNPTRPRTAQDTP